MTTALPLTIAGITRNVEVRPFVNGAFVTTALVAVARKNGGKSWPTAVIFWPVEGGYKPRMSTIKLNRDYPITGWNEAIKNASNHNSAAR